MALAINDINFEVGVKMQMTPEAMRKSQFDEDLIQDVLQGQKAYRERLTEEEIAKIRFINKNDFHQILNILIKNSPRRSEKDHEKLEALEKKNLKDKEQAKREEYDDDFLIMQKLLARRSEKSKMLAAATPSNEVTLGLGLEGRLKAQTKFV